MSADPLCSFTLEQMTRMMAQIFNFDQKGVTFWSVNMHIPVHRRAAIERQILGPLRDNSLTFANWRPDWPIQYPLYAPYAITKGEYSESQYSQVRFSGDKKKYYCHRAAYVHQHGPFSLGTDQQISHTRFLGKRTSRNINPRHTYAEPDAYNKARHHCHLYIDVMLTRRFLPNNLPQDLTNTVLDEVKQRFTSNTMPTCNVLHNRQMCTADLGAWVRDHTAPELAQEDYATEYETEDDAEQRLAELPNDYPSDALNPNSSFGWAPHPSSGFGGNYP